MNGQPSIPPVGNRRIFWSCVVVGWGMIVVGIRGVIVDAPATRPPQWSAWFVGAAVFHDVLVAPLVFAVAVALRRRVRRPYRAPLQAAMIATGLVAFASAPVVFRLGDPTGNPTVLPEDATPAFLIVIAAIWVATALLLFRARRGARATPPAAPG